MRALDGLSSKVDMILSRLGPKSTGKGEPDSGQALAIRSDALIHPEISEAMQLRDELVRLRDERRQHLAQESPSILPYESLPTLAVSPGGGSNVSPHFCAYLLILCRACF